MQQFSKPLIRSLNSKFENTMERKFKTGDLVVLKSGGPAMTVDGYAWRGNYESYDTITCHWFDGNTKMTSEFNQESVKAAE